MTESNKFTKIADLDKDRDKVLVSKCCQLLWNLLVANASFYGVCWLSASVEFAGCQCQLRGVCWLSASVEFAGCQLLWSLLVPGFCGVCW